MNWLSRLVRRAPRLDPVHASRVAAYRAAPPDEDRLDTRRLIVLDVETTGLDVRASQLIAIGAVAVEGGLVRFADSFYAVVRQASPSPAENILLHGIDGTTQTTAPDAADSLSRFLAWARSSPFIGFHADFDRAFIERAMRLALGFVPDNAWLDLADLAPALCPAHGKKMKTLDDWTQAFGISNYERHDALADALATAQLFQVLLARASREGIRRYAELAARAHDQRALVQRFGQS